MVFDLRRVSYYQHLTRVFLPFKCLPNKYSIVVLDRSLSGSQVFLPFLAPLSSIHSIQDTSLPSLNFLFLFVTFVVIVSGTLYTSHLPFTSVDSRVILCLCLCLPHSFLFKHSKKRTRALQLTSSHTSMIESRHTHGRTIREIHYQRLSHH
jgi:hypothetical protein